MLISLPDPFPGRCLNFRKGLRCLDYDYHDGRCRFPEAEPKPFTEYWSTTGWSLDPVEPEPWVSPLE